jgi:hypothetical protein
MAHNPICIVHEETCGRSRRNDADAILAFLVAVGIGLMILFVPGVNAPLRQMFSLQTHPPLDPSATVWVSKSAAAYYCPDSKFYGSGHGTYMKQGDALTGGYQPALGDYCGPKGQATARKPGASQRKAYADKPTSPTWLPDHPVADSAAFPQNAPQGRN